MKLLTTAAALLAAATSVHAASVIETYGPFTPGTLITDDDPVLTAHLHSVTTSAILELTEVEVSFQFWGTTEGAGFASDVFVSLLRSPVGDTPLVTDPSAVLLNRVGISGGDPVGFGYDGWNVTLKDGAANDIHGESIVSGVLSGTFQPDGRLAPTDDGTGRLALLSAFAGLPGNGDWRLNVGDLAGGGQMQLVSWSLTLIGEDAMIGVVPEASTWAAGLGLLAAVGGIRRRARRSA